MKWTNEATGKSIEIFNEDCMTALEKIQENEFELAIVDPPYRNLKDNQPTKDMRENGKIEVYGNKPTKEYFNNLFIASKNQIIWGANNFTLPEHMGFAIWRKLTIGDTFTMSMCEYAYISEGLGTTSKYFEYHPQDKNKISPTQKPVALYKWLLKNYAKENDRILDTHLGSGSIAIACWEMGFDLVGYELDKDYFEATCKRLDDHFKQGVLF